MGTSSSTFFSGFIPFLNMIFLSSTSCAVCPVLWAMSSQLSSAGLALPALRNEAAGPEEAAGKWAAGAEAAGLASRALRLASGMPSRAKAAPFLFLSAVLLLFVLWYWGQEGGRESALGAGSVCAGLSHPLLTRSNRGRGRGILLSLLSSSILSRVCEEPVGGGEKEFDRRQSEVLQKIQATPKSIRL